jgi:hypothetical protein
MYNFYCIKKKLLLWFKKKNLPNKKSPKGRKFAPKSPNLVALSSTIKPKKVSVFFARETCQSMCKSLTRDRSQVATCVLRLASCVLRLAALKKRIGY